MKTVTLNVPVKIKPSKVFVASQTVKNVMKIITLNVFIEIEP